MDFQFDPTADGRRLKFLNVTDEHTRLCLADRWRWEYNSLRPHSALQGRTPLEAAQEGAAT